MVGVALTVTMLRTANRRASVVGILGSGGSGLLYIKGGSSRIVMARWAYLLASRRVVGALLRRIRRSSHKSRTWVGESSWVKFLVGVVVSRRHLVVLLWQTCWVGVRSFVQRVGSTKSLSPLSVRRVSRQNLASGHVVLGRGTLKLGCDIRFLFTGILAPPPIPCVKQVTS